jgi:hypothetical protein
LHSYIVQSALSLLVENGMKDDANAFIEQAKIYGVI